MGNRLCVKRDWERLTVANGASAVERDRHRTDKSWQPFELVDECAGFSIPNEGISVKRAGDNTGAIVRDCH